ncbi:MAG: TIGR03936 family radical SAM-associated protein [Endomicrobiia bacterium]
MLYKKKYLYRIRFSRTGKLRFLSHLEQIETIRRAIRRAELPVNYSSGFHPQMKVSFGPAISVGYESYSEVADIEMGKNMDPHEIFNLLAQHLPAGFSILEIKKIPSFLPSIDSSANLAEYTIENLEERFSEEQIKKTIEETLSQKEIPVEISKNNRVEKIDLRKLIYKLEYKNKKTILFLRFGPKRNIKPEIVIGYIFKLDDISIKSLKICRQMLYIEKPDGTIVKI